MPRQETTAEERRLNKIEGGGENKHLRRGQKRRKRGAKSDRR